MRYFMLNKPRGLITANHDARKRTVMECMGDEAEGLFAVGRLDKDTEGLLILTDDGHFAHRIMTPSFGVTKTYFFLARGILDDGKKAALEGEMTVSGGRGFTSCGASLGQTYESTMREIRDYLPNENPARLINTRRGDIAVTGGYITITEGKWHQVKRMLMTVGLEVLYLRREAIGALTLDEKLPAGSYRRITQQEIDKIFMK